MIFNTDSLFSNGFPFKTLLEFLLVLFYIFQFFYRFHFFKSNFVSYDIQFLFFHCHKHYSCQKSNIYKKCFKYTELFVWIEHLLSMQFHEHGGIAHDLTIVEVLLFFQKSGNKLKSWDYLWMPKPYGNKKKVYVYRRIPQINWRI